MDAQTAYGFSCLVVGALLVAGQIWVLLRAQGASSASAENAVAAKAAAELAASRLDRVQTLAQQDPQFFGEANRPEAQLFLRELTSAQQDSRAAADAAETAKEAQSDWAATLATNLSSRVPLATAGIVLIVLGAVVNGYIDLSAGNGAASASALSGSS